MSDGDGVLSSSSFLSSDGGNFSSLCPNGSEWIWYELGECTQDIRDMISVVLGLLSIACFIVSSFPQYYSSCKTGNMDSALSIWFLLLWLGGDSCNLAGSFLADQLPLQKYTAVYYVLADLLMLSMYTYYKTKHMLAGNGNRRVLYAVGVLCELGVFSSLLQFPVSPVHIRTSSSFRGRTLLAVDQPNAELNLIKPFSTREIIGFTFGSISSLLYLSSRLPQIYTNFRRKSTKGVSVFLFALVILGNVTYGLSVLVKNPERGQSETSYIVHHLPWLIGSLGTLLLDMVILVQFMMYSKASQNRGDTEETTALLNA
ncbi:lysosomal amino acid transporter 1 homolog isoform X1 [Ictalurus punctatus]|uniref:Lysosomal amino acid transporter 1 homolog n=1 Tax=Ictalurus punctatus TaxID=7998 RepID=E3TG07_ICTPU|nr:lysosomal amino acid transporter 1 homolog [Ictalurus punctatus]XP_017323590.1 lysosomal amino acid transporter 1 homolog isoform X1 [Ictalurus punctatus]ADO29243.1 pq-loop repeat-containing protein 2 [Ictalurus punctatus]